MAMGWFPALYPDELLYSAIARVRSVMGEPPMHPFLIAMFGTPSLQNPYFPHALSNLVQFHGATHGFSTEDVTDHYTMIPILQPFLPVDTVKKLRTGMRGLGFGTGGGLRGFHPMGSRLAYCRACCADDRRQFGEPYWHRVHQIPGVDVCPIHGIVLTRFELLNRLDHAFISARDALPERVLFSVDEPRAVGLTVDMARDLQWILVHGARIGSLETTWERYQYHFMRLGLVTHRGTVRVERLSGLMADKVGRTLSRVRMEGMRNFEPWEHVAIIRSLGLSASEFFTGPSSPQSPFGTGPWPCLNPVASHHQALTISDVEVNARQSGRIIGVFRCHRCGFTYQRSRVGSTEMDPYQYSRVVEHGPVWDAELSAMYSAGVPLMDMSKRLKSSTETISRIAAERALSNESRRQVERVETFSTEELVELWTDPTILTTEICRRLGIGHQALARRAVQLGLPFPRCVADEVRGGGDLSKRRT